MDVSLFLFLTILLCFFEVHHAFNDNAQVKFSDNPREQEMSKYKSHQQGKSHQQVSTETVNEAANIARAIQKPNQTKEQTKLIAQGIQKGIAEYKKQQKNKAREQDKLKKKITRQQKALNQEEKTEAKSQCKKSGLAWILLIMSWLGMALFLVLTK